ncbi:uncharacterized protein LOC144528332 isoform X2 [Sander vitreus]
MSSESAVSAVEPRLHRLSAWFDPETAGVVTILLGLFQIVAGGSLTIANEKNSRRLLLRGCACSNVVGLLGTLLAFCLYCYSLSMVNSNDLCGSNVITFHDYNYRDSRYGCPEDQLRAYCWSVTLLLLLYNMAAVLLHSLLSVSALKALKTD